MSRTIRAVYRGGVLHPLDNLNLSENELVRVTVEPLLEPSVSSAGVDPLEGVRVATGIADLAERFGGCRFGDTTRE